MEEVKDGDNIIGSSDDAGKKDSKEPQKFVEGSDDKPKDPDTKTTKKKKKKKPKKLQDDQVEVPIDNQYDVDEVAQDAPNTLNKTRDLDKTQDLDQTKDNLFVAGESANVQDFASDEAKVIKTKKGKKKKKKKVKKDTPQEEGSNE